jgi:DGQHR domain-containing protein
VGAFKVGAIRIQQDGLEFFIFKMDAKTLLRLAAVRRRKENPLTGIQRTLNKGRLKEIANYIDSGKAVFPNSLVVNLPSEVTYSEETNTLEIPDVPGSILVIDGQHRLWSFGDEYTTNTLDLPVSGFVGISDSEAASIFVVINGKQRKINPSLVYDLFLMMRDENPYDFEDKRAQSLVESLYSEEESPWFHQISMLGGRELLITQATFVLHVKQLFKKDSVFTWEGFQDEAIQEELLFEYFGRQKVIFRNAWLNEDYSLCRNTGVGATIRFLNRVLQVFRSKGGEVVNEKGLALQGEFFDQYLRKIPESTFKRELIGQAYLGETGIRRLYEELIAFAGLQPAGG